jgi:hypothetical protein
MTFRQTTSLKRPPKLPPSGFRPAPSAIESDWLPFNVPMIMMQIASAISFQHLKWYIFNILAVYLTRQIRQVIHVFVLELLHYQIINIV